MILRVMTCNDMSSNSTPDTGLLQVVPCALLAVLSALLVRAMRLADKRRRLLKKKGRRHESQTAGDYNRTTSMLVAVVLCTVVTELPQGILAFLSGIDNDIFLQVYAPLGDVWDMVVLVNSAVNFLLYCTMSHQFRHTFYELFLGRCWSTTCCCCCCCRRLRSAAAGDSDRSHVSYTMQVGAVDVGVSCANDVIETI